MLCILFGSSIATEHDPTEIREQIGKLTLYPILLTLICRGEHNYLLIIYQTEEQRLRQLVRIDTFR